MMRRTSQLLLLSTFAAALPAVVHASPYDLIFADSIAVTATAGVTGFSYGNDIALIVNTGTTNIGSAQLASATFKVTSSDPLVQGFASVVNTAAPVTPVLPLEAVGTMLPGSPLIGQVRPGETARNVYPIGVFWFFVNFPAGYSQTVVFNITMTMGTDVAQYFTLLNIQQGPVYQIAVVHADRVSSVPLATAAKPATWGAIKQLYR